MGGCCFSPTAGPYDAATLAAWGRAGYLARSLRVARGAGNGLARAFVPLSALWPGDPASSGAFEGLDEGDEGAKSASNDGDGGGSGGLEEELRAAVAALRGLKAATT